MILTHNQLFSFNFSRKNPLSVVQVQLSKGCEAVVVQPPSPSTSSPPSPPSWYEFVIPEDFVELVAGRVYKISTKCNRHWKDINGVGCAEYGKRNYCNADTDQRYSAAEYYAKDASDHDGDGILETAMNCPGCGCGAGPEHFILTNLNDIYANQ